MSDIAGVREDPLSIGRGWLQAAASILHREGNPVNRSGPCLPHPHSPALPTALAHLGAGIRTCIAGVAVLCVLFSSSLALAGDLSVEDAWIRLPPPNANTAGYMTLVNGGDSPIRITGVRSDGIERLELHDTTIEYGVARMQPIKEIEIPAGERVTLAPRGLHLMLIRPGALKEGATVELVFSVEGQDDLQVEVPVRREEAGL